MINYKTVGYELLHVKFGKKYYASYIIHNAIFRPHWLRPFSNWSKYNAKLFLNTKWPQILMKCFHFSEQRFPRIFLNKVPIVFIQHFILRILDYCHISFQRFPHLSIIVTIFNGKSFEVQPVEVPVDVLCVFGCSRGWRVLLGWGESKYTFIILHWMNLRFEVLIQRLFWCTYKLPHLYCYKSPVQSACLNSQYVQVMGGGALETEF